MGESLPTAKQAARTAARTVRAGIHPVGAAERLAETFLGAFANLSARATIAGYCPIGDELDVRPLMERLHGGGHALCLPVVVVKGQPLLFRRWRPGDTLVPGGLGIPVPGEGAGEVRPDLLLVPLLAFDRGGHRLGYGAGFYDRTLALLRADGPVTAVGVGYDAQEVPAVPRDALDQPLDWIVTERRALRIGD
ncbi:MAG TPA: 5-formyltetrahydrofolate cyclo-ligase [Azospirillaceae bacterium]|nr:5-formyltetrahydrofolate cyclo-ligase [Azospirillaceae bacterium]